VNEIRNEERERLTHEAGARKCLALKILFNASSKLGELIKKSFDHLPTGFRKIRHSLY